LSYTTHVYVLLYSTNLIIVVDTVLIVILWIFEIEFNSLPIAGRWLQSIDMYIGCVILILIDGCHKLFFWKTSNSNNTSTNPCPIVAFPCRFINWHNCGFILMVRFTICIPTIHLFSSIISVRNNIPCRRWNMKYDIAFITFCYFIVNWSTFTIRVYQWPKAANNLWWIIVICYYSYYQQARGTTLLLNLSTWQCNDV